MQEDAVEAVPVNFLSKTERTRTGRPITLSYRALSSYWGTKSYFFLQKPLKTRVNSKYQSKGSTYILHLLAFVEIRLFNVFLWERKAGFGKLMKNVRDAGFSRKRGGNAGSGSPLPDPHNSLHGLKRSCPDGRVQSPRPSPFSKLLLKRLSG